MQAIRRTLKKLILRLINTIETYEFRHLELDQNDPEKKIIAEHDIDVMVESDSGPVRTFKILETQPFDVWFLELENGMTLDCADNHILFTPLLQEIMVKDLRIGDLVMTESGPSRIVHLENTHIPVSMVDLSIDHEDHRFFSNGILSHNSITSAIFLVWYLLFNHDKNAMILANVGDTAEELMDKVKAIVRGLPFFLKPGMVVNNVMSMKFDNGCRAIAKTTTKTSAIGFTIHFLYMDEFAHIHPNFIESFFRSTYPTVSSSKVSRIIITSTPNGQNKFWELYQGAVEGTNTFYPLRVDWWQIPGRDERWKQNEIANLGSEELFNQEYGNQFLSSSSLLLDSKDLKKVQNSGVEFVWREISCLSDRNLNYEYLTWHPKFDHDNPEGPGKRYILSVDIASGNKGDFTVVNIFKIVPIPKSTIETMQDTDFQDEADFFGVLQIGILRDNTIKLEDLKTFLEVMCLEYFGSDNVKMLVEMNFKGELLLEKLVANDEFYEEIFIFTKQSEASRTLKPGIRYTNDKTKLKYCENLRAYMKKNRIFLTDSKYTVKEMLSFGMNNRGSYSGMGAHDDVAMTVVNLGILFETEEFGQLAGEVFDEMPQDSYRALIESKLDSGDSAPPDPWGRPTYNTKQGGAFKSFNDLM
jgi:hypothetical protein